MAPPPLLNAVFINEHGGVEKLVVGRRPVPTPGPGQVLVRVRACGLNHLDIWIRNGMPGLTLSFPHTLGSDVAGTVEAAGSGVTGWAPGQRVTASPGLSCGACGYCRAGRDHLCDRFDVLGQVSDGGYAEYVVLPAANLLPLPDALSFEDAAAFPLVFQTAWHALVTQGQLQRGETALIHAAGSGLGSAAIQIAQRRGARVLTTVGSAAKGARAKALGADEVIYYREEDFAEAVKGFTGGRGADFVLDHIGRETFPHSLAATAKGGRMVVCGTTTGREAALDLRSLFGRNIRLIGVRMGSRSDLAAAFQELQKGRLNPVVDRVFPLAQAVQAQEYMESRRHFGKIVLKVD